MIKATVRTTGINRVSINKQSRDVIRTVGIAPVATYNTLGGLLDVDASDPDNNETLVYDAAIQDNDLAWSIRETYGLGRDRASCYAFAFGKHLVGDFVSGVLYELDENTHTDAGLPIVWSRTCGFM